jgi:1,2-diacylglycerol 3-alpha-glucosyltransferase
MKVIQVCPRYYPDIGGVETHVKEISERLVGKDFELEVVCTDPTGKNPKKEFINNIKVRRFHCFAPNDAYFFAPQIYYYLKKTNCDLIHAHNYHALPAFFAALAKNSRKFVFTPHYHGRGHTALRNILHRPYKSVGSRIFKNADKVICVSLYEKELIKATFGLPDEKLLHIPNGVNLDEFNIKSSVKDKRTILYVGRLEKYKGVQHIIAALPFLEDYKFVLVGKGPYEEELRKLALSSGVNRRIEWLRDLSRAELLEQYKSAEMFVFPSSFEAFGITVAEALASRTPCIVAKTGALEEFVDNKMCFGLNHPINTNELVEKLEEVSKMKIDFSDLPKDKIKSWDAVADEHEKLYGAV